ncbi:hypothetical protein Zmor_010775 [Zophobas morio]|uniref:Ribonucleotide reductase large subunit C-terminal domain-containing protein n=1 Tax=Zophobas morio TaxID=2755281 RepID=A0AA38IS22_9CUCU|nr:hypothetical protein Zmor_010775 [Zophobas morio]
MGADRGAFIDQRQSMNIHIASPDYQKITSMHFSRWKKDLKTGMYYLRTKPTANPIQLTVDKSKLVTRQENSVTNGVKRKEDDRKLTPHKEAALAYSL